MDKVNQKMRKFNLRGVLTGLRSSVTASQKQDAAVEESLKSEHFQISKVGSCVWVFLCFVRIILGFCVVDFINVVVDFINVVVCVFVWVICCVGYLFVVLCVFQSSE